VCLKCGTTFGTHGAPLKALFTFGASLITTKYAFTPPEIANLMSTEPGFLPDVILKLLRERGFLGRDPSEVRFGDIVSEDEAQTIASIIEASLLHLVAFCDVAAGGELSERSLDLFLELSDHLEKAGEYNAHTDAARVIKDLIGAASPSQVVQRAKELSLQLKTDAS